MKGMQFTFQLTVTNWLGAQTSAEYTVRKLPFSSASLSMSRPFQQHRSRPLHVLPSVSLDDCPGVDLVAQYSFHWLYVPPVAQPEADDLDVQALLAAQSRRRDLYFPPNTFYPGKPYTFELVASAWNLPNATASLELRCAPMFGSVCVLSSCSLRCSCLFVCSICAAWCCFRVPLL